MACDTYRECVIVRNAVAALNRANQVRIDSAAGDVSALVVTIGLTDPIPFGAIGDTIDDPLTIQGSTGILVAGTIGLAGGWAGPNTGGGDAVGRIAHFSAQP